VKKALAERLRDGSATFGVSLTIPDPFVAEMYAAQPLDFLMIDTEHSPISLFQLQTQLIALRTATATLLVRIPKNDPTTIMQVLDLGADGVVVPHIETEDECALAVDAALYPPTGSRGVGPRRAARLQDRATYFRRANARTAILIMIESRLGIENLDAILAVDALTGVVIGEADLAASLGRLGDAEHPDVVAAIDTIVDRCIAHDVPFGMYAPTPERADDLLDRGARIVTVGSDLLFMEQGLGRVLHAMAPARARSTASVSA
jgi:2-keto-3-deoxy-L-rhamnonate aldolase RhmA